MKVRAILVKKQNKYQARHMVSQKMTTDIRGEEIN